MLELGSESRKEHQHILDWAKSFDFNEIITVGAHFKNVHHSDKAFNNPTKPVGMLVTK